jgi:hypothetical protein
MKKFLNLAILAFFVSGLAGCNQSANDETVDSALINNPISAENQGKIDSTNLPIMQFDKVFHDFGQMLAGEKVTYSFKFTNTGKTDLIISTAAGSCGCTVPEFPKEPIKPGKTGFIKVQFNSEGRSGIQDKQVTIVANTIPNINELKIRAEVVAN